MRLAVTAALPAVVAIGGADLLLIYVPRPAVPGPPDGALLVWEDTANVIYRVWYAEGR